MQLNTQRVSRCEVFTIVLIVSPHQCPPPSCNERPNRADCVCEPGHFKSQHSSTCVPCDPGKFKAGVDSMGCIPCSNKPDGSEYLEIAGSSSNSCPWTCNAGFYQLGSACMPCPAGQYSEKGSTSCIDCPAGTFSKGNSIVCTTCQEGYASEVGSSSCCKVVNIFEDCCLWACLTRIQIVRNNTVEKPVYLNVTIEVPKFIQVKEQVPIEVSSGRVSYPLYCDWRNFWQVQKKVYVDKESDKKYGEDRIVYLNRTVEVPIIVRLHRL